MHAQMQALFRRRQRRMQTEIDGVQHESIGIAELDARVGALAAELETTRARGHARRSATNSSTARHRDGERAAALAVGRSVRGQGFADPFRSAAPGAQDRETSEASARARGRPLARYF